jgi:hypothetical protein
MACSYLFFWRLMHHVIEALSYRVPQFSIGYRSGDMHNDIQR